MRNRLLPVAIFTVVALTLSACSSTLCRPLVGYSKAVCEVKAVVARVEQYVPPALDVLRAFRPSMTPDVQARIDKVLATWPPLMISMDQLVATMEAGGTGDVGGIMANAIMLYIDVSALVVQCGGHAFPGLPATSTVNAVRAP